jgi:glycolate oxidase
VIVRLLPIPEHVVTMLGIFSDVGSAAGAVSRIIAAGLVPAAVEMIDALTIKAVQNAFDAGYPADAGAVLLIEVEGLREEAEEDADQVIEVMKAQGAREVRTATTQADRDRLWVGRKGALGALGTIAPNYYLVDGVVPRSTLPAVLQRVTELSERYGLPIANVFHAGDGNLHPCIMFDERVSGSIEKVIACGGDILKACVDVGGTLSGEHGIGLEKQAYMPLVFNNDDMAAMERLRAAFSPSGRFNPGKVFPGGQPPAVRPHRVAAGMWI